MATRIVVELIAAAGCFAAGTWMWLGAPASPRSGVVLRDARVPEAATTRAEPAASTARPDRDTIASGSGSPASATSLDVVASEPAPASLASPPAPSVAARGARTSAIGPLPPIVGPPAPRVPESLARVALRSVGKDAGAEAMWRDAIDDPGMPEEARSDLIEDLNDEGYTDNDRPRAADLPLILARLRIIERLAPSAMDDVNSAAFAEAYGDLIDMVVRLREEPRRPR